MVLTLVSTLLLVLPSVLSGGIFESIDDLPSDVTYDFLIVGGGTAGPVVARRLAENPNNNVLLLEAGPSHVNVLATQVPGLMLDVINPANGFDWNYTTTPQSTLNQRSIDYSRGFILGGCSAHNSMFWSRGSIEDWDRIGNLAGDSSWSWDGIMPSMLKSERFVDAADGHDQTGEFDPSVHSTTGMIGVSTAGFPANINSRVLQTGEELSDEFPRLEDVNSGKPLGLGWYQGSIRGGVRQTAASVYLDEETLKLAANLYVVVNARVTRVFPETEGSNKFTTIQLGNDNNSLRNLTAKKEVILSAGAINTPSILLHSGIGDDALLKELGIQTLHSLPAVGQNLMDQPYIPAVWSVNSTVPPVDPDAALAQWQESHTGPFTMSTTSPNHIAYTRLANIQNEMDPAAGPNTPHIEMCPLDGGGLLARGADGTFMSMGTTFLTPTSRGSVSITSNNPFDPPQIDLNMLATDFDVVSFRESLKAAQRFLQAPAWNGYITAPFQPSADVTTDDQLDDFLRENVIASGHASGTCSMSPKGSNDGVVDPDLRVKGLQNLRIVDASVIPHVPAGHTQAPVYAIAERAADLIKADWA
ncbi:hypothetical protein AGABI2DRAFT_177008 [Agaricus bisporus var. bisporus H97]|uniref:hypothetical protein n=1 Tax=Agaricus bisporus var. bisporus (strain H97 / ATCC MYA-4626 / FGSC 10389) TaxID=936046 RepID=UPI00029F4FA2|nr:hypothetical protein AGABI2DRAFT_177008 [Agaricus bisporus var. bisporus H97]EKV50758.1 hypothetical protein AGABI2DRAFT_177008 [Agaricus bisporus var. bisporus H97]